MADNLRVLFGSDNPPTSTLLASEVLHPAGVVIGNADLSADAKLAVQGNENISSTFYLRFNGGKFFINHDDTNAILETSAAGGDIVFKPAGGALSVRPYTDDTYYLGTATYRWKGLSVSGTIATKPSGAGIQLDPNGATGDFTLSLSPANLTANRRVTFPNQDLTFSSAPGAASAALMTPASGVPTLVGLKITATASADANTIDDYTEGTWTPTFYSTSASFTYTTQYGFYTKIGNVVHATIYLTGTATGTVTNGLYMVLTHTQKNDTGRTASGFFGYTDCAVLPAFVGNPNSTLVNINQFGTTTQLTPTTAGMTGGTSKTFVGSITYFV